MSEAVQTQGEVAPAPAAPAIAPAPAAPAPTPEAPAPAAGAPVRPEGIPDELWDNATGLKTGDLVARYRDVTGKLAEAEAARGEVPPDAGGYELKVPEGVEVPAGYKVELNPADPFLKSAQEYAHKNGWSKGQFSQALALEAQRQVAAQSAAVERYTSEKTALGANADARITAATDWMKANLTAAHATALSGALYSEELIEAVEALIKLRQPAPGPTPTVSTAALEGKFGSDRLTAIRNKAA